MESEDHYEIFPLFPAPQPHDPITGDNLGDPRLPTLPQMEQMVAYSHDELPNLTLTRDHIDDQPVGQFTSLWLDKSGKAPRVMAQVKFDKTALGQMASVAVESRWYDAISPEWHPLTDQSTGKVVGHLLKGASITPIPRQKGGEHGTWVFGYPAEKKAAPSNDDGYKVPSEPTLATHLNSTTSTFSNSMSDNTPMMKASADAAQEAQAMDVVEPATLQGVEGTTEAHPQDPNRGGGSKAGDVTLRADAYKTLNAQLASMSAELQEQKQLNQKWSTYAQQHEQQQRQAMTLEKQRKLTASMETAKEFRNQLWAKNVAELKGQHGHQVRRLRKNKMLAASMDAVSQAIEENNPEKLTEIQGSEYLLAQMEAELEMKKEADAKAEKKRMEEEIRAKIKAEEEAKFAAQVSQQLGDQMAALQSQIDSFKSVPLPPQLNQTPVAPVPTQTAPAPMDIQTQQQQQQQQQPMIKASLDSGMSSSSSSAPVDKFEQMYGIKRSQVVEQVTLRASADAEFQDTLSFMRDGRRSVARQDQRFRDIALADQLAYHEQLRYYGGQLPPGVPPLCISEIVRAALDTPIGERAMPWRATEGCINPNHNPSGVMMVRYRR